MTKSLCRWTRRAVLSLAVAALVASPMSRTWAADPVAVPANTGNTQVATVDQLKTEAFSALKSGKFEQSNELLAKAASISQDPAVRQMSGWMKQFESQRQEFATERHKQFEKAVADVHKLIDNHKESFALDYTARAALLADDKKAFRAEPWVDALVKQTAAMAIDYDKNEQWLKAMR